VIDSLDCREMHPVSSQRTRHMPGNYRRLFGYAAEYLQGIFSANILSLLLLLLRCLSRNGITAERVTLKIYSHGLNRLQDVSDNAITTSIRCKLVVITQVLNTVQ